MGHHFIFLSINPRYVGPSWALVVCECVCVCVCVCVYVFMCVCVVSCVCVGVHVCVCVCAVCCPVCVYVCGAAFEAARFYNVSESSPLARELCDGPTCNEVESSSNQWTGADLTSQPSL